MNFMILSQVRPDVALMGAKIGLLVGASLATLSGIGFLINKIRNKESKWLMWAMIFGACATVTGIINILSLTK